MSLSTRHSIQWPESATNPHECEPTTTVVITSPSGLYVDIRQLKSGGFDWYFAGCEINLSSSKIEFNHDFFDSAYIDYYYANGSSGVGFPGGAPDIGDFKDSEDAEEKHVGIRLETGVLMNAESGIVEPYIEKWITCDPTNSTLKYIDGKNVDGTRCVVIDTVDGGITFNESMDIAIIGRYIVYGNWIQGLIWDKNVKNQEEAVGVYRHAVGTNKHDISYGGQVSKLPNIDNLDDLLIDDVIEAGGIMWIVKEIHNWI